jgi:hypothetical protein
MPIHEGTCAWYGSLHTAHVLATVIIMVCDRTFRAFPLLCTSLQGALLLSHCETMLTMGECVRANLHVLDGGSDHTLSDPCHETIAPCQCMFNLLEQQDLRIPFGT